MSSFVLLAVLSCLCCVHCAPKLDAGVNDGQSDVLVDTAGRLVIRNPGAEGRESQGSTVVVDYERSVTGIHDADAQRCYLIGGIPHSVPTASELKETLENGSGSRLKPLLYRVADDYPIRDLAFLPAPLQSACAGLPLNWMEPSTTETDALQAPQKGLQRWCWRVCVAFICYTQCN